MQTGAKRSGAGKGQGQERVRGRKGVPVLCDVMTEGRGQEKIRDKKWVREGNRGRGSGKDSKTCS